MSTMKRFEKNLHAILQIRIDQGDTSLKPGENCPLKGRTEYLCQVCPLRDVGFEQTTRTVYEKCLGGFAEVP